METGKKNSMPPVVLAQDCWFTSLKEYGINSLGDKMLIIYYVTIEPCQPSRAISLPLIFSVTCPFHNVDATIYRGIGS